MFALDRMRPSRGFMALLPCLLLAGCFGTGEGPERILGTPAPPPPPLPPGFCDDINFEDACDPVLFLDFAGGATAIVDNPTPIGINTSEKVVRMQKFTDQPFGGSRLEPSREIDFAAGEVFKVKVLALRAVPMLFKFEGPVERERELSHSGSGTWEELCFDFRGDTAGVDVEGITVIFDNGVQGDAANDPDNWTFWFDDIEQDDACGDGPVAVDFEDDPASYDFGAGAGFGGGVSTVIANPDQSGINPSAQVAQMQKFAGELFGGSTLNLGGVIDFSLGDAFLLKVWSPRPVPVLFKLEGLDQERTLEHSGSGTWEQLCFDFAGTTSGAPSSAITFIFDNGVAGAAGTDPTNWTFYFDDIEQVESCDGGDGGGGDTFTTLSFDDPAVTYALRGFGGAEDSTLQPDPTDAANTVVRVNRSDAAEVFAGTVVSTGDNESVPPIPLETASPRMSVRVLGPAPGIPVRLKIENSNDAAVSVETEATTTVADAFETLTFDFLNEVSGTAAFDPAATYDKIVIFFNFGTDGATAGAQTFFFDDIAVVTGGDGDGGGDGGGDVPVGDASFDFEGDPAAFDFGPDAGFGGGVSTVIANPDPSGINTSAQVVQMQKFEGEVFGGSTLALPEGVDFSQGAAFRMKVWSARTVPVLFKLEGLNQERSENHDGGSEWQQLCFDFRGTTDGPPVTGITVIFDLGVVGDAANDPVNWTFYYDDIEQVADCGIPPAAFPIDFEDDPTSYDFGAEAGFAGGVSTVIANPDPSGINTTAQTARMQKFAGEPFGGSTLDLGGTVDFTQGTAFRMKVWATRPVPVLFKFEGLNQERTVSHSGSGTWEELCFDFTGATAGPVTSLITFIFDNGVVGNAENAPNDWTFYFDEIEQTPDCGIPPAEFPIGFEEDPATYDFGAEAGFAGGVSTVVANPLSAGINTSAQTARMQKFGGDVFGGSTLSLGGNVDFSQGTVFAMKVLASRAVPVLFKFEGLNQERTANHSGSGAWEELCFDFTGSTAGPVSNAITFIFDNGVLGDADNAPDDWTFYFDDIRQLSSCPPPDGGDGGGDVGVFSTLTFDDPAVTYTLRGFNGAEDSTLQPDPDDAANQVVRVNRSDAAAIFAGTVVSTGPNESVGAIPLDPVTPLMSVRVNAPGAGIPVRLKIENSGDAAVSVETEATTTSAGWQSLTFDFSNEASGTAAFDPMAVYDKLVVFFNFGTDGATAGAQTFYFDDVAVGAGDGGGGGGGGDTAAPIDFESGEAIFNDFEGGAASVVANPDPSGINTSGQVGQMQKFAGQPFAGSTLALGAPVPLADGDSYLMKVRALREVVVTFKLEPLGVERTATHSGSGTWEELCFDFTGVAGNVEGLTLIFDNGVVGDAANDPDAWTFQFDDIRQTSEACPADPPDQTPFTTITFDDPDVTYTLADFGGNSSTITNDPAGGSNMVALALRTESAAFFAGTTVSTLPGDAIPRLPLDAANTQMNIRVYPPAAGVPVRLKVEDATNPGISVETEAVTTVANAWETLTFDFANEVMGTPPFDEGNDYTRLSIFFDFGAEGTGEQTWYFDDIAVGPGDGGGGGGAGILPDAVVYATDPAVMADLAPPAIDNFGSGAVFDAAYALDVDYNPAFAVTSGEGYGAGVHVGFVAFLGYPAGFAAAYETLNFKVKDLPTGTIEVKLFGGAGDNSIVYDVTSYAGSVPLANGWYQVSIPVSDFAATIDSNDGFLLGPLGGQAGPFTFLLTDIGFSGTAGGDGGDGGGGGGTGGDELAVNGDFEAGDLSGWTIFDNGGFVAADNTQSNGGAWSVHVVAATLQNPVLKQANLAIGTVMTGDTIVISFDMKGSALAGGVIFPELFSEGMNGASNEILDTIAAPTADWSTYSYMATAGADVSNGITFQLGVVCGGALDCSADVFIDNVSVSIAP